MNWESEDYKNTLIELKPRLSLQTRCPYCNCMDLLEYWIWQGVHFIGIFKCFCCERKFYLTLPTGHAKEFPVAMDENFQAISYPEAPKDWLAVPLINSLQKPKPGFYNFDHQVRRKKEQIIIINCLDTCYGHVLYKLFYSQQYLAQKEYGLLYLVPENVVWMVPERADELLVVKGRLGELNTFDPELDGFLHRLLKNYDKVFLSESLSEADEKVFEKGFFFPMEIIKNKKEIKSKSIVFIIREDRPWIQNRFDYLIFMIYQKWKHLKFLKEYLIKRQIELLEKLSSKLKAHYPQVKLVVSGFVEKKDNYSGFDSCISNLVADIEQEKVWLQKYNDSDIIIGVHGSHMIIPSIFAPSIINIIPPFKNPHTGEDIFRANLDKVIFLKGFVRLKKMIGSVKQLL